MGICCSAEIREMGIRLEESDNRIQHLESQIQTLLNVLDRQSAVNIEIRNILHRIQWWYIVSSGLLIFFVFCVFYYYYFDKFVWKLVRCKPKCSKIPKCECINICPNDQFNSDVKPINLNSKEIEVVGNRIRSFNNQEHKEFALEILTDGESFLNTGSFSQDDIKSVMMKMKESGRIDPG